MLQKPTPAYAQTTASCNAPTDVVIVMDASGSMYWNLPYAKAAAKAAAKALVDQFKAKNGDIRVALVGIKDYAKVYANLTPVSTGYTTLITAINTLDHKTRSGPATCIACGLKKANEMLNTSGARQRRVVLLSDGKANTGTNGDIYQRDRNIRIQIYNEVKTVASTLKNSPTAGATHLYVVSYSHPGNQTNTNDEELHDSWYLMRDIATSINHFTNQSDATKWPDIFKSIADKACPVQGTVDFYARVIEKGPNGAQLVKQSPWTGTAAPCGIAYENFPALTIRSKRNDNAVTGDLKLANCHPNGPFAGATKVAPASRTITPLNIPPQFNCVGYTYYKWANNAWQAVANSPTCSFTGNIAPAGTAHLVHFWLVRKAAPPPPTTVPSRPPIVIPTKVPVPTIPPQTCEPPINSVGTRLPGVTVIREEYISLQKYCAPLQNCRPWPNMNMQVLNTFPNGLSDVQPNKAGLQLGKSRQGYLVIQNVSSDKIAIELQLQCRDNMANGANCAKLGFPEFVRYIGSGGTQELLPGEIRKYQESRLCAPFQIDLDRPTGYGTAVYALIPSVQGAQTDRIGFIEHAASVITNLFNRE